MIDEGSFKILLNYEENQISREHYKTITNILSMPFNGYLISLSEFKHFLESIISHPTNSN